MKGNHKSISISVTYLPSVLYLFRTLTCKTVKQLESYLHRRIPGKGKAKVLISRFKGFKLQEFKASNDCLISLWFVEHTWVSFA